MGFWDWAKSEGGNLVNTADLGAYNPETGTGWATGKSGGGLSGYLHGAASGLSGGLVGGSSANPSGFLGSGKSVDGSGSGGLANALEGDPHGYASALNGLVNTANSQAQQVKNFLLSREQQAQQNYAPMKAMFSQMYGTGGIMPASVPGVPGSRPF